MKKLFVTTLCMTLFFVSCQTVQETALSEYESTVEATITVEGNTLYLPGTTAFDPAIFSYIDTHMDVQDGFQIVWGNAVLSFGAPMDAEATAEAAPFTKVEAFGQVLELQTNFQGNHRVELYQTAEYLLISDTAYTVVDTWLLHTGGIWKQHNDATLSPSSCNDPILYYTGAEDDTLTFTCTPRKYIFTGGGGDVLLYSAGGEEIYTISGTAVWNGTEMEYEITEVETLAEHFPNGELETMWEDFRETIEPTYDTIDEYFAANQLQFGTFVW